MKVTYAERQAIFAAESIDHGIIVLEIFEARAETAIPLLRRMVEEIADGGLDERDRFRSCFLESLIKHLAELHGIEAERGA